MRLYAGSSTQFFKDNTQNLIAEKLREAFFHYYRFKPAPSEVSSWRNSLRALATTFQYADLNDHGVIFEYQLPMSSKRLDCIVCGKDKKGLQRAVIVELKQWEKCQRAQGENEVLTWIGGAERERLHPSVQVGRYRSYLEDTHTAFQEDGASIALSSCSYLHNYFPDEADELFAAKFKEALSTSPIFAAESVDTFREYLTEYLSRGDGMDVLRKVEESKYRPSKKLMNHVAQVIKGTGHYVLIDEQLVAYDSVFAAVKHGFHQQKKSVILIKGGPGTGKSVVAINLMADLLRQGYNAHYATGSRAFTETLRKVIGARGGVQFNYFNSYAQASRDEIDVLIADESHRIRITSNNRFTPAARKSGTPQIDELLKAARVCVFFVDDRQVVRPGEIGDSSYIKAALDQSKTQLKEYELDVQFRCSGSEEFINWIENTFAIRRTPNVIWDKNNPFDFQIVESPGRLEEMILKKISEGVTGRVTAGYCWKWSDQVNPDGTLKLDVNIGDYRRPWNARPEATHLAKGIPKASLWAYEPGGINQIGCVYTAQGFEFDYVGVIVGPDLVYDFDRQDWTGQSKNSFDTVVKRSGAKYLELVKNTYRVLLSRGMKGCYVCFLDKDTEKFVKSRMESTRTQERNADE